MSLIPRRALATPVPGQIATVAGTGAATYDGEGSATAHALNTPFGVAVDGAGNLYIADGNNNRVRKVDAATGLMSTLVNTSGAAGFSGDDVPGGAAAAQLYFPIDVAVDPAGTVLLIADLSNFRIRRVDLGTMTISTIAGNGSGVYTGDGPALATGLYPTGVAMDSLGVVYVADQGNDESVRKISGGQITTVAGTGVPGYGGDGNYATLAQLSQPSGVAVDPAGTVLYIAEQQNAVVRKVDLVNDIISTVAGTAGVFAGDVEGLGDGGSATGSILCGPYGLAYAAGSVYVADMCGRLRMIAADGTIVTVAGKDGGSLADGIEARDAGLSEPVKVAVGPSDGAVYVSDDILNKVRRIDPPRHLAVNSTADAVDAVPGDGVCETAPANATCTLRAAIQEANALGYDVSVSLPAGTYTLAIPGAGESGSATGDLNVTGKIALSGAGAPTTIIDGGALDRVLDVASGAWMQIAGVTVRGGASGAAGGGGLRVAAGGQVLLGRSIVRANTSTAASPAGGGGIDNDGSLTVIETAVEANASAGSGGGIHNTRDLAVVRATLSENSAAEGGGLATRLGTALLSNATVSGNAATTDGGGVWSQVSVQGDVRVNDTTIAYNRADSDSNGSGDGGGLYVPTGTPNAILRNSILAANVDPGGEAPDCFDDTNNAFTLIGDGTGCNWYNAAGDVKLGPLRLNGGFTRTHALLSGSPAIDAGSTTAPPNYFFPDCSALDQRGVLRPQGAACDAGAFEVAPGAAATPAGAAVAIQPQPDVSLAFANVTSGGQTTVTAEDPATPIPPNFALGTSNPKVYEISTTASFSGAIAICLAYDPRDFPSESNLSILHFTGGQWVEEPSTTDLVKRQICASVTSLSPFAVVGPQTVACGDGVIAGSEQCDDHNTTDGDGCSSSCTIEPFHTCSGSPSVCSVACAPVVKPKLTITKLDTPPGDDKLTFSGLVTLTHPFSPALDLATHGVRLLVNDKSGNVVDVTVPGGVYSTVTGVGWKTNKPPVTSWTYVNKTVAPPGGIYSLVVKDKSAKVPGELQFTAKGKVGSYVVPPAALPASAMLVIDQPLAPTGQCANATFPGPKPQPLCAYNKKGSTLTCK